MNLKFNLTPVTLKRLRRFRQLRRAYISAWLLVVLVLLTLLADLLCNANPLLVRFRGRTYFPVLRFYPESEFIPGGNPTRPDYKALREHPLFQEQEHNFMIFAPVPYGPRETIDEQELLQVAPLRVRLTPVPRAASINIAPDTTIVREQAAVFFLDREDQDLRGHRLDRTWTLSANLRESLRLRFENRVAPAFRQSLDIPELPDMPIEISMPSFTPRQQAPQDVRLTLRTVESQSLRPVMVSLTASGKAVGRPPPIWEQLEEEDRERLRGLAATARTGPVLPLDVRAGRHRYRAVFDATISWPHPPVRHHWLGIDSAGRDVLSRIVHGLRMSLMFGVLLVIASMIIGIIIGALQGYYGGITDIATQRGIEIWSAIPFLYVMILLGSIYGAHFWLLLLCYALFNWIGISYYMRAEFLRLRNQPFVDAARVLGVSNLKIIFRHIMPNALTPVITFAPFSVVGAIGALAALDYLGFGLPALTPSLGELLHQAQTHRTAWWLIVYPSLALFIVMLLGVFVGEGVREAYDPRPRSHLE